MEAGFVPISSDFIHQNSKNNCHGWFPLAGFSKAFVTRRSGTVSIVQGTITNQCQKITNHAMTVTRYGVKWIRPLMIPE